MTYLMSNTANTKLDRLHFSLIGLMT